LQKSVFRLLDFSKVFEPQLWPTFRAQPPSPKLRYSQKFRLNKMMTYVI